MISPRMQQTIAAAPSSPASVTGAAAMCGLEFRPAAAGTGITFVRSDLGYLGASSRRVELASRSSRRTNLRQGRVEVEMVEHVLARSRASASTTAKFGPTIPKCPAATARRPRSSTPSSGLASLLKESKPNRVAVTETVRVAEGESWIEARPSARESILHRVPTRLPGGQRHRPPSGPRRGDPGASVSELAPCRTFCYRPKPINFVAKD